MVASDYDIETDDFGVNRVLEQALRVILFLRRPIPEPKRGHQSNAPFKRFLNMAFSSLKLPETSTEQLVFLSCAC
jgi:hypothetical protein